MAKGVFQQIGTLIILTLCLITPASCVKQFTPSGNESLRKSNQEVKSLIEEIHSDHDFRTEFFIAKILAIGEDAVIPLLEIAKNNHCRNCWDYIKIGIGHLAQTSETARNTVLKAIEKNLLNSKDSDYVCFLIGMINSAHYDSSIKDYLPLTPNLVSVLKRFLRHSGDLDSQVQYETLKILRIHDIEIPRETVGQVLLNSLQSNQVKVRYDTVRDLIRGKYLTDPKFQDALSEFLFRENDPAIRKEILQVVVEDFTSPDKKIIPNLIENMEKNIEAGEILSFVGGDYSVATYPLDDSLMFLMKLTDRELGKVNHKSSLEEKRVVIQRWNDWWETNKNTLKWNTFYRIFVP